MKKNCVSVLIVAALPLMTLTGCAASGGSKVRAIDLPAPPSCMNPVDYPTVQPGMDARASLARHRAALLAANGNLSCSRTWYARVRTEYRKQ